MNKKLIIIEGPDGVGKSTISDELLKYYKTNLGDKSSFKIIQPNSEGSLGFIRPIVKGDKTLQPFERQLLHSISHIQDLHTIFNSDISIMDRSIISAFVYSEANEEFPRERLELLKKINIEPHISYFLENEIEIFVFFISNKKSFRDIEAENDAYSNLKFDSLRSLYIKHAPKTAEEFIKAGIRCTYCEIENINLSETVEDIIDIINK